jgi:imidazolonepropionase-like amidohydrolase
MTPAQAIVAATRSGAIAARTVDDSGTIQAGKRADLLLLDADPLADIHNIRKISSIYVRGRAVDRAALPERRVLSRAAAGTTQ